MTTAPVGGPERAAERRFYAAMAWTMLGVVFLGFARSYYLRPLFPELHASTPPERFFYAVHGVLFTLWIVLLAVQPTLIAVRRLDLHRLLGWIGTGLAVAMIVAGVEGARMAARRPRGFFGIPVPAAQFMVVPLTDMLLFGTLVGLAVYWRKNPQAHKRLMLLASFNLVTAAIARVPISAFQGNPLAFFGLTDLFLLALIVWDLKTRRGLHPATLWGGLALLISQPLRMVVSGTAAWKTFASWLIG